MLGQLSDAEQPWPVLRVPFAGGHTALAVYANYDDENSIEFTVRHPAWGRLGHLGQYPRRIPLAQKITAKQSRAPASALGHPGAARMAGI